MIQRIQEFCQLLRCNRVPVALGEELDCMRAACVVGLDRQADLRVALAAALCKRPASRPVFDELFSLHFLRGADFVRDLSGAPLAALLSELGLSDTDVERILAILADQAAGLSALARSAMGLRALDLTALLGSFSSTDHPPMTSPLQVGYFTERLLGKMGVAETERELSRLVELLAKTVGREQAEALRRALDASLQMIRQAVRRHVREQLEKHNLDFAEDFRARSLSTKPFALLGEEEIAKLRVEVKRLARRLRALASRRHRTQLRGRLDVRRTLRASLRTGGVPVLLSRRRRLKDRPRLVILCDISDSVRHVSRFMLELVFTIQDLFQRVRTFVFVSDLGETTCLFRRHSIDEAVRLACGGAVVNVHANSNYGRAFEVFVARHIEAVTSKTTVMVIGDARNNYNPAKVEALVELRRRARRLWWLNPESPGAWGFGDSVMTAYKPHCDKVAVTYNLESLRKIIDELVQSVP